LEKEQLDKTFERFKQLADKKKNIFDDDLMTIVEDEIRIVKPVWQLVSFQVNSGTQVVPQATVNLKMKGKLFAGSSSGDGPVDACYKAADKAVGIKGELMDYRLEAVTQGKDAIGEVNLKVKIKNKVVTGRGSSTDIVEASLLAYLNAVNKYAA
jgi:2-isopropylmalate synthase